MNVREERVMAGFNMLTREERDRVDLAKLDMNDTNNCVWGQVTGGRFWPEAEKRAGGDKYRCEWAVVHGFDIFWHSGYRLDELQPIWEQLLKQERGLN